MPKLVKEVGRGYVRGSVIWLISAAVVFPLTCVLICLPLWLVTRQDAPMWILILSGAVFLLLLFGSIPVVLYGAYRKRKKWLDAIFLPLGLEGSVYQIHFRQYHGQVKDREMAVRFYRGPVLEIEVKTNLQISLVASQDRPVGLSYLVGQVPLTFDDPAYEKLQVYTRNMEQVQQVFLHPDIPQQLMVLTTPTDAFLYRHVILREGKLILMSAFNPRLFRFELDPDEVRSWTKSVLSLADMLESTSTSAISA